MRLTPGAAGVCSGVGRGGKWGGGNITTLRPHPPLVRPQPTAHSPGSPGASRGVHTSPIPLGGRGQGPHSYGSLHSYGDRWSHRGGVCTPRGGLKPQRGGFTDMGGIPHRRTPRRQLCIGTGCLRSQRRICTHTGALCLSRLPQEESALTQGTLHPQRATLCPSGTLTNLKVFGTALNH